MRHVLACVALILLAACDRLGADQDPPMTARIVQPEMDPVQRVLSAYPKDDYETAVLRVYEMMQTPDAIQQICSRWFPTHGRDVADAFLAWRARHEEFMREMRDRAHAIWVSQGGGDVRVVRVVEYFERKDRMNTFMRDFDRTSTREYESRCIDFPRKLKSAEWNLPKRFARDLAVIRVRPRPEPIVDPAQATSR
jgi:hypothetical protein